MKIKKVEYKITKTGCWDCISHKPNNRDGYPYIQRNRNKITVSRYMWIKYNGAISDGFLVLHKCDNKLCINPAHLYLGTHKDNNRDIARRERSANMKLSNADVLKIRQLDGKMPRKEIALHYDISICYISQIINHKRRKHI